MRYYRRKPESPGSVRDVRSENQTSARGGVLAERLGAHRILNIHFAGSSNVWVAYYLQGKLRHCSLGPLIEFRKDGLFAKFLRAKFVRRGGISHEPRSASVYIEISPIKAVSRNWISHLRNTEKTSEIDCRT